MSGVIHPLRLFVFAGCIGTALTLTAVTLTTANDSGSLIRSGRLWEPREASVMWTACTVSCASGAREDKRARFVCCHGCLSYPFFTEVFIQGC